MKKVINTEKKPIKLWLDDMEEGAMEQAKNLANLPFIFKHIAIMPDSHQGYGMPIGGVMATKGVVVPNAVGVDIGCGMCAVKTSLTEIDTDTLKKIMGEIRKAIPVGKNRHKEPQDEKLMPHGEYDSDILDVVDKHYKNARESLGTLGGGNHFIEIQKGNDGHIWIMIHSGSRNLGHTVATHYNKKAKELNEMWHANTFPVNKELNFLPLNTDTGKAYLREMNYCVEYALANRKLMMERVKEIFIKTTGYKVSTDTDLMFDKIINIAHNYAKMENHFGENVMVHRKGATLASTGNIGIIPGSQGSKSYIVRGLGNSESFNSCSHGAGRLMGRKKAIETLNLIDEIKALDDMGVIHTVRSKDNLDEAPGSYKDIDKVMEDQNDLVEVITKLTPLCVVKG